MISKYGDGADIAMRVAMDGNEVKLWIEEPKYKCNFDGLIPKVDNWQSAVSWSDCIVFDNNKMPEVWDRVNKIRPTFGGSRFGFQLEQDRGLAHRLMSQYGIPKLESKSFKTLKEVIPHLKEHKVAHVVKPQGKKVESHHLIVGQDQDNGDAIAQVERLIAQGVQVEAVEVEERKFGVEVGLSIWFNGQDVVGPVNVNFEHKRSYEKEVGYLTGEMGTLMRYIEDPDNRLYTDTLKKMIPALRAANYRGQLDLNMVVDAEGAWPLEFTPRLGYPAVFIEDELHVTPWGSLFHGIATGQKTDLQVRYDWAVGVVMCGFGFPFEDQAVKISKGLPIKGISEHTLDHIHPMQVCLGKKGFEIGHGEALIAVATGRGSSIYDAKSSAYGHLSALQVPNAFYRHDISDKIYRGDLERLGILPIEEGSRV